MLENIPLTRQEAVLRGHAFYMGSKPCKAGHWGKRRTDSRACVECYEEGKAAIAGTRQLGRQACAAVMLAVGEVVKKAGGVAGQKAEALLVNLAGAVKESPAIMQGALEFAPVQTDDGVLWALTAKGRSLGRAAVAAMLPGDAMNAGYMERLK